MHRYFVLPLLVCALASAVLAASLGIGASAGEVRLTTPEGNPVLMKNYAERKATAVWFLSTRGPGVEEAAPRLVSLNQQFRRKGILFIGVFPNSYQTGAEVRAFCQAHGFNFPVYLDPKGEASKHFGARVTPEVFLLDKEGKLLFHGSGQGVTAALTMAAAGETIVAAESEVEGAPIGKVFPKSDAKYPYGSIDYSSELIFESIPGYPVHHCSTITEAPNGDLLVSWYGGSYESSDDQVLFLSRRKKGEQTWSKPEIIVRGEGQPPGNAVLFTDKQGRVWLVWGRMEGSQPMFRGSGWDECSLFYRISSDNGRTWSADQPFYHNTYGWLPRNLSITLRDGSLLLPLSDELNGHGVDWSFFLRTKDNGKTWTQSAIMRGGEQPTIIERADGTLLAFLRTYPNILAAESRDSGKTWSEPVPTIFKNPDSGISMRRLNNGHVILVFNNQDDSRTPLHIVLSKDEARTWGKPLELETNPGEYSYPSVLQTSDGKIHIIYTFRRYSIKHIELNEDWLTRFERPD
ncbi:MAG: exo-alpha-sialidase [Bryobacterales bacterium]|nr:exo-alpha-sialidase [Bryobacterales bacterium]